MKYAKTNNPPISILSIHWGLSVGGVSQYAAHLEESYKYQPVRINSICILEEGWSYDQTLFKRLKAQKIEIQSRCDFPWQKKISAIIKSTQPDLLLTHGFNGHFIVLITRLLGTSCPPVICTYHGKYLAQTPIRKIIAPLFNRFTEYFIKRVALSCAAVSHFSRNQLLKQGIPGNKIATIHNGIDKKPPLTTSMDSLRQSWDIKTDEILLGTVCRLDAFKGVNFLLDAFSKISNQFPSVKLIIIGDGPEKNILEKQSGNLGVADKIVFTGFRQDIASCLQAFDIFILPSLYENHSIAILEAMRAGKAIITTDVGGNTESIRHQQEGLIVPVADANTLSKAIKQLITSKTLRQTLQINALKRFQDHFTVDAMARHTAEWFMQCGKFAKKINKKHSQ